MELRQYGVATTIYFPLIDFGATDFLTGAAAASGDIKIQKDGGAAANTNTATFTEEAHGFYSLPLTATEMQAKQIVITIIDQTATKEWEDQSIVITTINNASAEIPTIAPIQADVRTAVGLASADLDTQIGGLDTKLDTIDDFVDTEVAAIKAKTDLIPASPAAVSDIPTAIQNADALLTRDIDNVEATAPVHSLTSMILKLVSRFVAATGVTYRTDGTTTHMTQTPSTDASADPVTELGVGA